MRAALTALAILLALVPASQALDHSDIYVRADAAQGGDGSPGAPFRSIQQGIDACASGGTVHVYAGSYYESFFIDKPLHLKGDGIDSVRIYVGESPAAIFQARDVIISGVVIITAPDTVEPTGTGLHAAGGSSVILLSCKLPYLETGVLIQGSDVVIADSILEFSDVAVFADSESSVGIYANVVVGNGAVVQCDGAPVDAIGNAMVDNGVDIGPGCAEAAR